MRIPFSPAEHSFFVTEADRPVFDGKVVHNVCSTYALAREFEWAGRRVYLASSPQGSEAIGTQVEVLHKVSASVGTTLTISAEPISYEKGWLVCKTTAYQGSILIAEGTTTQKVKVLH
jgi:predicted thioesterase